MSVRIEEIVETIDVSIQTPTGKTVTVKASPSLVSFEQWDEIVKANKKSESSTAEDEGDSDDNSFARLVELFCEVAISWSLIEDDGSPIEISKDRIMKLKGAPVLHKIIEETFVALNPTKEEASTSEAS